jgi:hypothetical protein
VEPARHYGAAMTGAATGRHARVMPMPSDRERPKWLQPKFKE